MYQDGVGSAHPSSSKPIWTWTTSFPKFYSGAVSAISRPNGLCLGCLFGIGGFSAQGESVRERERWRGRDGERERECVCVCARVCACVVWRSPFEKTFGSQVFKYGSCFSVVDWPSFAGSGLSAGLEYLRRSRNPARKKLHTVE